MANELEEMNTILRNKLDEHDELKKRNKEMES